MHPIDHLLDDAVEPHPSSVKQGESASRNLPIFSVLSSIDFSDHFLIIGDVGTGKSTVTPVHEFELGKRKREVIIGGDSEEYE